MAFEFELPMDPAGREALLEGIGELPDDELLALAYTFVQNEARLRLYLELFRRRSGARAQMAASLLCFDLARRGDAAMGAQFVYLRGTMQSLAQDQTLVDRLIGDHAYLRTVWAECAALLREDAHPAAHDAPGAAESWGVLRADDAPIAGHLDLLDDADLPEEAVAVDEEAMWRLYVQGCDAFFGGGQGAMAYDSSMGFRLRAPHGQARAQGFLTVLEQCAEYVPAAQGMRPLLLLAWGLSLKSHGLLGQVNKRREHLLTEGLFAFANMEGKNGRVARVLGPLYADPHTWEHIWGFIAQFQMWHNAVKRGAAFDRGHVERFVQAQIQG